MNQRCIFHVDVNSAFLSWESAYRLKQDPSAGDLRLVPSVVGGDEASRHGIVLAKSIPAKAFGIRTAEPLVSARKKCPGLIVIPSRFDLYLDCSRQLTRLLSQYTPELESFSIDEAFLDMTETIHLFGSPADTANAIRRRVKTELGFTVNVGISSNKLLAKMASDFEKPDRTHTLFPDEVPSKMWPLPIQELFFVGQSAAARMNRIGLHTIGDAAHCDPAILKAHLGDKCGTFIHQYANGIDPSPVISQEPAAKGCGNSITLPRDISDFSTACQVLLALSETVGTRLRLEHMRCGCVCVELKDWNFSSRSHQLTLTEPTDSTSALYEIACRLLKELWNQTPVRLIGLRATHMDDGSYRQIQLFETKKTQKMRALEAAVDSIRSRYGMDSIQRASFLQKNRIVDHTVGTKRDGKFPRPGAEKPLREGQTHLQNAKKENPT